MWFTKSKRAQTSDDFETWIEGGVVPTLNAFDCGDTRATVVIVMREREGKAGGVRDRCSVIGVSHCPPVISKRSLSSTEPESEMSESMKTK
jgi:hypothetical protein